MGSASGVGGPGGFPGAPVSSGRAFFPEESQATTGLVLSIIGLFCCGLPSAIGVYISFTEKQAISAGRRDPANEGQVIAGIVIGIVACIIWGIGALVALAVGV